MQQHLSGIYGTLVYLPASGLARRWRRWSRKIRNKDNNGLQQIQLPGISWRHCTSKRLPRVFEHDKANGNIRISELAILSAIAEQLPVDSQIFEIGTFDGRTSLNLAFAAPESCRVHTLDLPQETEPAYSLAEGERHMVEKERSGSRIDDYRASHPGITDRIQQWYGDSATFDYTPFQNRCSMVFIDGSHAYDYVLSDTRNAMSMVIEGGVILWHDYGIWEGVTRALEDLERDEQLGLRNVRGTSLVYWRKPG
ncbi:MAG: class I SAM-dependent methyltransferase [Pseudomonadota bacterium]